MFKDLCQTGSQMTVFAIPGCSQTASNMKLVGCSADGEGHCCGCRAWQIRAFTSAVTERPASLQPTLLAGTQ